MIVIDGDSVALATRESVYPHQTWWALLRDKTIVLATPQATAEECLGRIQQVISAKPTHYILLIGQWSHNHEEINKFADNVKAICKRIVDNGIGMLLVTPPYQEGKYSAVEDYAHALNAIHTEMKDTGVKFLDFYGILKYLDIYDTDKIHLGAAGNKLLAEHVTAAIQPQE